jgi:hypothetical protein
MYLRGGSAFGAENLAVSPRRARNPWYITEEEVRAMAKGKGMRKETKKPKKKK